MLEISWQAVQDSPYKRAVMTDGVTHALTSQERPCYMKLFFMLLLLLLLLQHVRQTLWQSLSATLVKHFLTCQHLREQNCQQPGNLTDIGLVAQRLLSEALPTSPEKSAQLPVLCEQLHTHPWRQLRFRHRSVNTVIFTKSQRPANISLAITPNVKAGMWNTADCGQNCLEDIIL